MSKKAASDGHALLIFARRRRSVVGKEIAASIKSGGVLKTAPLSDKAYVQTGHFSEHNKLTHGVVVKDGCVVRVLCQAKARNIIADAKVWTDDVPTCRYCSGIRKSLEKKYER